jgi:glycosyltransferase involved in cell wall biosynthesis
VAGEAIFHSNTSLTPKSVIRDLALCLIARATGKRVLLHIHGGKLMSSSEKTAFRPFIAALLRTADHVVVLSRAELDWLSANYPGAAEKIEPIYNFSVLADRAPPKRTPLDAGQPLRVVFVGRLVQEKGIDALLAAVASPYAVPIDFTVFGEGAFAKQVREAANNSSNLEFRGVHKGDPATMFDTADILVLPSLYGEGMPMVIIEAMSCGCVPVASGIGSIPEIIEDGRTGFLIRRSLAETLGDISQAVAADPIVLTSIAAGAREFATHKFSPTRNAMKFHRLYARMTKMSAHQEPG